MLRVRTVDTKTAWRVGRKGHRRRGSAMATVLAVAALALLASFVAAGVATLNLRVASRISNSAIASALAESVVQEGLAHLQDDLGFDDRVAIDGPSLGLPAESRGLLTFDRATSGPFSTNNFLGESQNGWQRTLPAQTAHLVGIGECGGVTRHVEVIVHLPEFPVSMACDGPVLVSNSLIGSFKPADNRPWNPGTGYAVKDEELGPGHLVTNATGDDACVLDAKTKITGDIQSRGRVQLNGALVEGEVRAPWGRKAPLPNFVLSDFDPKANENSHYEELPSAPTSLTLIGNVRRAGNLSLSGDLRLDNAFLFVDGDLTVDGAFRGIGAVAVTGKVTFGGAVDIGSDEQLAVLSGGGITITGPSSDRAVFRGLLYSRGPFEAKKVTIVGGFIVADGAPTKITDSSIFYNESTVAPQLRKEVFAVVPRFMVRDEIQRKSDLIRDEAGFAAGLWDKPGNIPDRNVDNVIDLDEATWRRSNWDQDDPAVLSVRWVNDEPVYRYTFYGHADQGGSILRDSAIFSQQEFTDVDAMATEIARQNTADNVVEFLNGTPPDRAAYEEYLKAVAGHLRKSLRPETEFNFSVDPNEFIKKDDKLRISLHRTY